MAAALVGGAGDLEQLTAALDAVTCSFVGLDEGIALQWVFRTKKAVARLSRSTSAGNRRFSTRLLSRGTRWSPG
jgi:hypothetical protein